MNFLHAIEAYWRPALEVGIFWFAYYLLLVYVKDSGMTQALKGLFFLVILFFLAAFFELKSVQWVLSHLFQISIIGVLIIFHPELRRGLSRIGQSPLFKLFIKEGEVADEVIQAVVSMSKNRIGALIAIEREESLKSYADSGIQLDAVLTAELLTTVFMPNTPFHDGGVLIQGNRISAVGCLFPLSQSQKLSKVMGTRHRAGLGMSEESDAVVIVVSEETGGISLMIQGRVTTHVDEEHLRQVLRDLRPTHKTDGRWKRFSKKEAR